MERLYTTHEISRLIQVDPSTVSKWIDKGILAAFRTPGGHRRVRSGDLRNFLLAHHMPLPEELGTGVLRLLVVDDEKGVVEGMKRAFRAFGSQVEVTTTTSGVEALLMVSEQKPHGLLVDLNMPGLDGFEVCRKVNARRNLEGTKVIAMTGRPTPELIDQALKAGAVACFAKPVDAQQVMDLFRAPAAAANRK